MVAFFWGSRVGLTEPSNQHLTSMHSGYQWLSNVGHFQVHSGCEWNSFLFLTTPIHLELIAQSFISADHLSNFGGHIPYPIVFTRHDEVSSTQGRRSSRGPQLLVSPLKMPAQSSENKGKKNCQTDQRGNSLEMSGRHVKTRGSWRELVCEKKVMQFFCRS